MKVHQIQIWLCQACLDGVGSECHTPGCAMWMHSIDLPFDPDSYEILKSVDEDDVAREAVPLMSLMGKVRRNKMAGSA